MSEVQLCVGDVKQRDVGRGIARIDQRTMQKLGISAGDVIEIINKRTTSAIAWQAYNEDENQDIIRIDGFTRKNAGVAINENVVVRPAKVKTASSITLAPIDMRLNVDADFTNFVKNRLMERTLVEGDTTLVMMLGHAIPFTVPKTTPDGIVKITMESQITILNEPILEGTSQKAQASTSSTSCVEALREIPDETFEKLIEAVIANFFFDTRQFNLEEIAKETGTTKELVQSTAVFLRDNLIWSNLMGDLSINSFQRMLLNVYKYPQTKIDILTKHFEKNKNELRFILLFNEIRNLAMYLSESISEISLTRKELKDLYGHVLDVCTSTREETLKLREGISQEKGHRVVYSRKI